LERLSQIGEELGVLHGNAHLACKGGKGY
jgi:hypothetical protein